MGITAIDRDYGNSVSMVRVISTDTLATVGGSGYLTAQEANIQAANNGEFTWLSTDMVAVSASDGHAIYEFSNGDFTTLVPFTSVNDSFTIVNPDASFSNLQALTATGTNTATVVTAGDMTGGVGQVKMVGASGGTSQGLTGSVTINGALTSSAVARGVHGTFDLRLATINGGFAAPLWGDFGTDSGTFTSLANVWGLALINNTTGVINAGIRIFSGATNLLNLDDNNAVVGASYFQAAGTGAGSCGAAVYGAAAKAMQISVNGTSYWLPLYSSNS